MVKIRKMPIECGFSALYGWKIAHLALHYSHSPHRVWSMELSWALVWQWHWTLTLTHGDGRRSRIYIYQFCTACHVNKTHMQDLNSMKAFFFYCAKRINFVYIWGPSYKEDTISKIVFCAVKIKIFVDISYRIILTCLWRQGLLFSL